MRMIDGGAVNGTNHRNSAVFWLPESFRDNSETPFSNYRNWEQSNCGLYCRLNTRVVVDRADELRCSFGRTTDKRCGGAPPVCFEASVRPNEHIGSRDRFQTLNNYNIVVVLSEDTGRKILIDTGSRCMVYWTYLKTLI